MSREHFHKVPVLLDGDFIVWNSLAIMEYLAEKYSDSKDWPEDIQARGFGRLLIAEMHSSFSTLRDALPMNCRKTFSDFAVSTNVQEDIDRCVRPSPCIFRLSSLAQ